jgi:hypothetical protein
MDPHVTEYAGAIAGMADTYGSPAQPIATHWRAGRYVNVFALGSTVRLDATDGTTRIGRVEEVGNDDLYIVACDDGHKRIVHADAIYPF